MDWVQAKATSNGGWTKEQLAEWGIPWPPPKGWKKDLLRRSRILTASRSRIQKKAPDWVRELRYEIGMVSEARRDRLEFLLRWAARKVSACRGRQPVFLKPWARIQPCWVCRSRSTVTHHIVQVQHGGTNVKANLCRLCDGCHAAVHPWMDASEHPIVKEARELDARG